MNFLLEMFLFSVDFDLYLSVDLLNLSLSFSLLREFSMGSKGTPLSLPFLKTSTQILQLRIFVTHLDLREEREEPEEL